MEIIIICESKIVRILDINVEKTILLKYLKFKQIYTDLKIRP